MAEMSGAVFLMAGLGDGHMLSYQMDRSTGKLSDAKKFTIGAQQVRLNHLRQKDGRVVVFACADHPTVVHADGDKLRFANVNIKVNTYLKYTQSEIRLTDMSRIYRTFQLSTLKRHPMPWPLLRKTR